MNLPPNCVVRSRTLVAALAAALAGCMVGPGLRASRDARARRLQGGAEAGRSREPRDDAPKRTVVGGLRRSRARRARQRRSTSPTRPCRRRQRACARRRPRPQRRARASSRRQSSTRRRCAPSRAGNTTSATAARQRVTNSYNAALDLSSWELDLWGRHPPRRRGERGPAQAIAADLAAAQLVGAGAARAGLPAAPRAGRGDRAAATTPSRATSARCMLTQNQYAAGVVARGDVAQAEAQLASTQAQQHDAHDPARAARARDRGPDRQAAGRVRDRAASRSLPCFRRRRSRCRLRSSSGGPTSRRPSAARRAQTRRSASRRPRSFRR